MVPLMQSKKTSMTYYVKILAPRPFFPLKIVNGYPVERCLLMSANSNVPSCKVVIKCLSSKLEILLSATLKAIPHFKAVTRNSYSEQKYHLS